MHKLFMKKNLWEKKNSCGSNILATDVYNDKTIYQPTTVLKSVLYLYNSLTNNNNKKKHRW